MKLDYEQIQRNLGLADVPVVIYCKNSKLAGLEKNIEFEEVNRLVAVARIKNIQGYCLELEPILSDLGLVNIEGFPNENSNDYFNNLLGVTYRATSPDKNLRKAIDKYCFSSFTQQSGTIVDVNNIERIFLSTVEKIAFDEKDDKKKKKGIHIKSLYGEIEFWKTLRNRYFQAEVKNSQSDIQLWDTIRKNYVEADPEKSFLTKKEATFLLDFKFLIEFQPENVYL